MQKEEPWPTASTATWGHNILEDARNAEPGVIVRSSGDVKAWLDAENATPDRDDLYPATWVIDENGLFRIASRPDIVFRRSLLRSAQHRQRRLVHRNRHFRHEVGTDM